MRLSDKCHFDGCDKPHHRVAAHIDAGGHRHDFCCEEHQIEHLRRKKREIPLRAPGHRIDVV